MYESFICMYVYTTCVPGNRRDHNRTLNALRPELWMKVSHHVGSGNQTRFSTEPLHLPARTYPQTPAYEKYALGNKAV